MEEVPDAKTLARLGQAVGPETIRDLHDRLAAIAQARKVIRGGKMRVDTTVVESNIHYPTDSGLLNDCLGTARDNGTMSSSLELAVRL
jgi:transposase, IS5 family